MFYLAIFGVSALLVLGWRAWSRNDARLTRDLIDGKPPPLAAKRHHVPLEVTPWQPISRPPLSVASNAASEPSVGRNVPNIETDHALPLRQAFTETLGYYVAALVFSAVICVGTGAPVVIWTILALLSLGGGVLVFLRRYEQHVLYVRGWREPVTIDLDEDAEPDNMVPVWYGNGAPPASPGSLEELYRQRLERFIAACKRATDVTSLEQAGFSRPLQFVFRNWLIDHGAGAWRSERGHNPGWDLGTPEHVARALRCTGFERDKLARST